MYDNIKPLLFQYIADIPSFQLVKKEYDNIYKLSTLYDSQFEIFVNLKCYSFIGRVFDGWNLEGLKHYIGLCVPNRKNIF
jgi:hypothetical protein